MEDVGSSVTLIFYRISDKWWKEPALNVISAVAQMSSLTHVEIALGEEPGHGGTMKHVARIFNDNTGVANLHDSNKHLSYPSLCFQIHTHALCVCAGVGGAHR